MLFEVPLVVAVLVAADLLAAVEALTPALGLGLALARRLVAVPSLEVPGGGVGRADARRLGAGAGLVLATPVRAVAGLGAAAVVDLALVKVELGTVLLIAPGFASAVVFAAVDD